MPTRRPRPVLAAGLCAVSGAAQVVAGFGDRPSVSQLVALAVTTLLAGLLGSGVVGDATPALSKKS
jgi:hypothetical protein